MIGYPSSLLKRKVEDGRIHLFELHTCMESLVSVDVTAAEPVLRGKEYVSRLDTFMLNLI